MKVICSWCQRELGEKEPKEDKCISHTICEECIEKLLAELKEEEENPDTF